MIYPTTKIYPLCLYTLLLNILQVYDPNRFLTDSGDKMDSFAFVPFSAGPR